jgi:acyl carrier protein
MEQQIAEIWQQVLGMPFFSIHDNFFELGGNSLLGTQVISRLRDALFIDLSLQSLFKFPTVAELACNIQVAQFIAKNEDALITDLEEEYEEGYL